jgi:hypothetical protein
MTNPELPDPNDGWGEPWPGMGEPAQTPPCDIAPLERFVTPPGLDGSAGAHRCAEHCLIGVDNDLAAIDWWVTQASSHETTAHSRRAVADKLLNWACFVKGKAVSSLDEQDFAEFARFLAHPQPLQRWVGARVSRTSMRWRPFAKPLVGSSRDNALRQVAALVHWLFEQRYADLRFSYGKTAMDDGTATVAVKGAARRFTPLGTVTPEEWHWIRRTLSSRPIAKSRIGPSGCTSACPRVWARLWCAHRPCRTRSAGGCVSGRPRPRVMWCSGSARRRQP